jgi:hypothetical protein
VKPHRSVAAFAASVSRTRISYRTIIVRPFSVIASLTTPSDRPPTSTIAGVDGLAAATPGTVGGRSLWFPRRHRSAMIAAPRRTRMWFRGYCRIASAIKFSALASSFALPITYERSVSNSSISNFAHGAAFAATLT